jgi:hypothetical protein
MVPHAQLQATDPIDLVCMQASKEVLPMLHTSCSITMYWKLQSNCFLKSFVRVCSIHSNENSSVIELYSL